MLQWRFRFYNDRGVPLFVEAETSKGITWCQGEDLAQMLADLRDGLECLGFEDLPDPLIPERLWNDAVDGGTQIRR